MADEGVVGVLGPSEGVVNKVSVKQGYTKSGTELVFQHITSLHRDVRLASIPEFTRMRSREYNLGYIHGFTGSGSLGP